MIASGEANDPTPRRERLFVAFVLVLAVGIAAAWFATGHASAPDGGLQQLDILTLHEKVPGVVPVDGRPTMVVLACRAGASTLSYPVVVHRQGDPGFIALTRALALPRADDCQAGYVLVDAEGFVRYRTYDPGWARHSDEQSILLAAL